MLLAALFTLIISTYAVAAVTKNMGIGKYGTDVNKLQKSLKALGIYFSATDSLFGAKTRLAISDFQLNTSLIPKDIIPASPVSKTNSTPKATSNTKSVTGPTAPPTLPTGKKEILGYVEDLDPASYNSVSAYASYMTSIATFSYKITPWGSLEGNTPYQTVHLAKSRGLRPLVLIHNFNGSFDPALADSILGNTDNRRNLISNLLNTVRNNGYSGVNIDIEGIYQSDRSNYVNFLKEVKQSLAPYGLSVTVAIPAKDYDNQWNSWSNGYDYQGIGQVADQIVIMTYDENWGGNGPVASLPWVTRVVQYAVSQIPRQKILLGIATYGYDSPGNKSYGMKYIKNTILPSWGGQSLWNDQYNEPYYTYWYNGTQHTIWYEDERSNAYKLNLVNQYNLAGIGIWRLGYEDQSFWNMVKSKLG